MGEMTQVVGLAADGGDGDEEYIVAAVLRVLERRGREASLAIISDSIALAAVVREVARRLGFRLTAQSVPVW